MRVDSEPPAGAKALQRVSGAASLFLSPSVEEGKLLTDDVWEGITGASLFIPLGGLDEVEEDEEDEASGEGER